MGPPASEKDGDAMMVTSESPSKGTDKKKAEKAKKKEENEELSEEDQALKDGLELAVTRLTEETADLHKQALNHLVNEIRSSTSSMTSVPKPLKFLRPHYDTLKGVYDKWSTDHDMKKAMADMLSVLAMTMAEKDSMECLKFKLAGTQVNIASWGHEYVRYLSGEIAEEYNKRMLNVEELAEGECEVDDLLELVDDIIPFQMSHNAEAEAADLLIETQQLSKLVDTPVVDERNYERVCLYLLRSAGLISDPDDLYSLLSTCFSIYKVQKKYTDALRVALLMDDTEKIAEVFAAVNDSVSKGDLPKDGQLMSGAIIRKQMAFLLARHRSTFSVPDEDSDAETLNEIIGNLQLSDVFLSVTRNMDVLEPKTAEDIYKSGKSTGVTANRGGNNNAVADSARANLATSFVNAFVNAGYGKDKLVIEDGPGWVVRNKEHGMISAAASVGMVMLWNIDEGLNQIDVFMHHSEVYVRAGALMGIGIMSSGIRNETDAAMALLTEQLEDKNAQIRISSGCGLGIAYAGAQREELEELLTPIVANTDDANIVEVSFAALSLGLSFVGTCNDEIASVLVQRLMEASEDELNNTATRFLCLGLGLLYLGKTEKADATIEAVKCVEHLRGKYAAATLSTCAYAGTGNVLQVQKLLKGCAERLTENAEHQAVSVLGIALVALGEEVGAEMTLRTFEHLLHYGELPVRRAVPLAIGLLYVSNPDYSIVDQLSRLSHDTDPDLAQGAIFALGLVSAGSNNSRVAGLLRGLSEFYAKQASHLFVVRIAQGLNVAAKGLVSLASFHSDKSLMNAPALAGVLTVLHACLDIKGTILDKFHYILYYLSISINPRIMTTVDTELNMVNISTRVGTAVETVGQAGRPKTITGFQTHTSPVLLGASERAEFANQEYLTIPSVLEGVVIVEKAPEEKDP